VTRPLRRVGGQRQSRRPLLFAALTLATLVLPGRPTPLEAQEREGAAARDRRLPRRFMLAAVGALAGAAASSAYLFSGDDNSMGGTCTDRKCVVPISIGGGALIGFMIGREFDQLHALRYRGGAPLNPPTVSTSTIPSATVIAARDTLVAVGGAGGIQLLASGKDLRALGRRARGVRGIAALDLVPGGSLALGSAAGFYLYPPGKGPGSLVREGSTTAVTGGPERVYVGVGARVEVVPPRADTTRTWPGVDLGAPVVALAYDGARRIVWALTDSSLIALRPVGDSIERLGAVKVGAGGRRLAAHGTRVAVAMGEAGVRLFDAADPTSPREIARWNVARFVYDVSFGGRRLYAASGIEGVYVLDAGGQQLVTEGLARELGFAVALASADGYTFVLDRTTDSVRRIPSDF